MRRLSHRIVFSGLIEIGFLIPLTAAIAARPSALKIPDSTPVRLFLTEGLNSATNEIDDPVHFEVAADVRVGGVIVIPKGSVAGGHVVEVQHRKMVGRGGKLEFTLDYVKAPDGTNIPLRADSARQRKGRGTPRLSPLLLTPRGKTVAIPQGTHIVAYVNGDQEISLGSVSSSPAAPNAPPVAAHPFEPAPTTSDISSIVFTSTPEHADITVDEKFLGTTPSTIRLAPGDHSVTIEKSGFKAWQRIMTVTAGGSITLDVTLEKIP